MLKIKKHIEIVRSSLPGMSSLSRASCEAIYIVLKQHYREVGVTVINDISDLELLISEEPDLVFMGMKYLKVYDDQTTSWRKIWISSYLEQYGIEHTGSTRNAIRFEADKSLAKQQIIDSGLKTPAFFTHNDNFLDKKAASQLRYPLFVKPSGLGGGQGIDSSSVVYNHGQLEAKIDSVKSKHLTDVLVEEYLPGREFSVAVLNDETTDVLQAMPLELIARQDSRGHRILSKQVKSSNEEAAVKVIDQAVYEKVCALALDAFRALGARDYGRVDIRLDETGVPHFLEANLIPSLIEGYGSFPKACALNLGLGYEAMILRITRLGLNRNGSKDLKLTKFVANSYPVTPSY